MNELTLIPKAKAAEFLFSRVLALNPMASMFKQTLLGFITSLYASGYVLAQSNQVLEKLPIVAGGINFFGAKYAQEFILTQAANHKLPVSMIQKDLEKLVLEIYAGKYIFGSCETTETQVKVTGLLAGTGTVKLVLKPPERAPE
jgi:hypothetical protein